MFNLKVKHQISDSLPPGVKYIFKIDVDADIIVEDKHKYLHKLFTITFCYFYLN